MANINRTQHAIIALLILLFLASVIITIAAGQPLGVAVIDNSLDALQIDYNLIQFSSASNPYILVSKLIDAAILPLLTVVFATWFFDFINNISLRERFVLSKVRKLENHVVIVPYNSFAKSLMDEFKSNGIRFVVIAENKKDLLQLYRENELAIGGDIRSIETFETAGISKAKCVVTCSKDDIQNALASITARAANPGINIISKANKEENSDRLERAGSGHIILAEYTAGEDIGNTISKRIISGK